MTGLGLTVATTTNCIEQQLCLVSPVALTGQPVDVEWCTAALKVHTSSLLLRVVQGPLPDLSSEAKKVQEVQNQSGHLAPLGCTE